MIEINFVKPLLDLNDKPVPNSNLNDILASLLANSKEVQNAGKFFLWAVRLNKKEKLELDEVDFKLINTFVKQHPALTVLMRMQLVKVLEDINS